MSATAPVLLLRVGSRVGALRLADVVETMRPLPCDPVPGLPDFALGLSIIRGAPVPVLDLARLLGEPGPRAITRYVTVRAGERTAALAVEEVLGTRELEIAAFRELPPLVANGVAGVVAALGSLDQQLLVLLQCSRTFMEALHEPIESAARRPTTG
jgi:purine-binding chemotaxis protein CheW